MARAPRAQGPSARRRARGEGAASPETPAAPSEGIAIEILRRMYETMVLTRQFDRKMVNLQRQGRVRFFGTSVGEEAAVVASAAAVEATDWIFPALRQLGALLWRGYPLARAFAQNMGNRADLLKGRQMPCHYSDREFRAVSWSSCIGTQLTHATGAAYAARLRRTGEIVLAYLGDGATSANDFHAALTFAGVWKVPCVFFCQNNQWAISVPRSAQTASATLAVKGKAYGVPGVAVDGNDAIAVYEAVLAAADRARAGDGPTLVEAVTYRMLGHSSSDDPTKYRDDAQVREWAGRDPIDRMARLLRDRALWDDARQTALEARVVADLDAAVREAEAAGPPPTDTLFDDVLAQVPPFLAAQREALRGDLAGRGTGPSGVGEFPL